MTMDKYLYNQSVDIDSHGQLGSIFHYLIKKYGEKETIAIVEDIARDIYRHMIEKVKRNGLVEMEEHFNQIMALEKGRYSINKDNDTLEIVVERCPAIGPAREHMERRNMRLPDSFCRLTTGVVNNVIASEAGYRFSLKYDQEKERCIQRFWKD